MQYLDLATDDLAEREEAQRAQTIQRLQKAFHEALHNDLSDIALWDYRTPKRTVAEVLDDALWALRFRSMTVLVDAASGRGTQRQAQRMLEKAVEDWCSSNVDFYTGEA